MFYSNRTIENLEKYVLSEVYLPISDYANAVEIIRNEDLSVTSKNLMILETYFCYTQLYSKSKMFSFLEESFRNLTKNEKAVFYYLKALSFFGNKEHSRSVIKNCLDKSLSYKVPFVSNFLYRAELEDNKIERDNLLESGYNNIRRIYTIKECETSLDEQYYFNIRNFIDSEIKSINLTEIQVMLLFPNNFKKMEAK